VQGGPLTADALSALLALSALAPPASPPPTAADRYRAFAEMVNRRLVYSVPGEDSVRVRRDVVYRSAPEALADIHLPAEGARRPAPVVVLVHGSLPPDVPVKPKDWGLYQSWGRVLAASGFVAVTFNHRLGYPEPRIGEAASDVAALLEHVRAHARAWDADPDRIAIAAFSGGGPLLAPYIREPRPFVRGLAAFYAILDVRGEDGVYPPPVVAALAGHSPAAALAAAPETVPPLFVMRAGRDRIPGLNAAMDGFVAAALKRNAPLTLMVHPTGSHGFENTDDDERSREILAGAIAFLRAALR
jgi:acetyl esterase/lipase